MPNLVVFSPYPMTIAQMGEWAEKVTQLDRVECAVALHKLDHTRTIPIRRA
jgi:hypothetical protein